MRDVIGIRYFQSTLGSYFTVIFRVKDRVRIMITVRVRVLVNSDHCV